MFRVSRWTGAAEWRRKKWIKHQISPGEETETGAAALRVHSTAQGAEEQSRASVQIHIKVTLLLLLWRRQIWFADIWSRPFSAVFLSRVSHGRMQVLDLQRKLLHFCGQVEPPPPQTEGSAGPGRVALLKWCDFFFFFWNCVCVYVCVCVDVSELFPRQALNRSNMIPAGHEHRLELWWRGLHENGSGTKGAEVVEVWF